MKKLKNAFRTRQEILKLKIKNLKKQIKAQMLITSLDDEDEVIEIERLEDLLSAMQEEYELCKLNS